MTTKWPVPFDPFRFRHQLHPFSVPPSNRPPGREKRQEAVWVGGGKILAPKMCRASLFGSPNLQLQSAHCPEKLHLVVMMVAQKSTTTRKSPPSLDVHCSSHETGLVVDCSEKVGVIEQTARYSQSLVSMFRTQKN